MPCIPSGDLEEPLDPNKYFADVDPLEVITFADLCEKKNKTTDE